MPDVIILDLGLPDMDGVEIIRKIRGWSEAADHCGQRPDVRISDKVEALDAGADDYLTKPFSIDELLARLRVALRRAAGPMPRSGSRTRRSIHQRQSDH